MADSTMMDDDRWFTYGGRRMLRQAGGSGEDEAAEAAKAKEAEEAAAAKAAAEKAEADAAAAKKAEEDAAKLGDAGKAALDAERKARRDAEKAARDAQAKLDAIEAEKLSETEKAEKRATDAEAKVTQATERLRRANLIAELSKPEHKIVSAAAAAKLIEGVEFDDDDEPTNLGDVLPTFLEANSFLTGEQRQQGPGLDGGAQGGSAITDVRLSDQEVAAAKRFGMTPEEYAKYKDPAQPAGATQS